MEVSALPDGLHQVLVVVFAGLVEPAGAEAPVVDVVPAVVAGDNFSSLSENVVDFSTVLIALE